MCISFWVIEFTLIFKCLNLTCECCGQLPVGDRVICAACIMYLYMSVCITVSLTQVIDPWRKWP